MMDSQQELGLDFKRKNPLKYYLLGIAPVIVLLLMLIPFWGFVSRVVMGNPLLNGKIIGAMLIGICIIMQRIYLVQKEYAVLDRFMEAFVSGQPMADLLTEPSIKETRVAHVLETVVETEGRISSQIVQTAMMKELDHVQHSFQASYDIPNFVVGFMISLGLLGTFIGLLETMLGLSEMLGSIQSSAGNDLSKAVMGLIGKLQVPLAGMGTAFAASLFGLVGSCLLAIMMLSLKHTVAQFMHALRRYLAVVVEHDHESFDAEPSPAPAPGAGMATDRVSDAFLKDLTAQMSEQYALSQELFRQSEKTLIGAIVRVDTLTDQAGQLFELMKTHVEINRKMYDLLAYGPRMRDLSEQTLAELKTMTAGQYRQEEGLNKVTNAIVSVDQLLVHVTGQLGGIADSFVRMDQSESIERVNKSLSAIDQRFIRLSAELGEIATILNKGGGGADMELAAAVQRLHADVSGMAKESNQGVQVAIDIARHLAETNATLKEIRQNHELLSKMQEASAKQTVLAEMLLDEFRHTRTTVVRDVRAEFRELSRSMAELSQGPAARPESS